MQSERAQKALVFIANAFAIAIMYDVQNPPETAWASMFFNGTLLPEYLTPPLRSFIVRAYNDIATIINALAKYDLKKAGQQFLELVLDLGISYTALSIGIASSLAIFDNETLQFGPHDMPGSFWKATATWGLLINAVMFADEAYDWLHWIPTKCGIGKPIQTNPNDALVKYTIRFGSDKDKAALFQELVTNNPTLTDIRTPWSYGRIINWLIFCLAGPTLYYLTTIMDAVNATEKELPDWIDAYFPLVKRCQDQNSAALITLVVPFFFSKLANAGSESLLGKARQIIKQIQETRFKGYITLVAGGFLALTGLSIATAIPSLEQAGNPSGTSADGWLNDTLAALSQCPPQARIQVNTNTSLILTPITAVIAGNAAEVNFPGIITVCYEWLGTLFSLLALKVLVACNDKNFNEQQHPVFAGAVLSGKIKTQLKTYSITIAKHVEEVTESTDHDSHA
jgi:hypothetical protein